MTGTRAATPPSTGTRRLDPAARLTIASAEDALAALLSKEDGTDDQPKEKAPREAEAKAAPRAAPAPPPEPETEEPEGAADEPEPIVRPRAAEAADDAEETEAESEPPVRRFRLPTGEEVAEDELLKGYSRTADYTRKTQALAEERRKAEAEFQAVKKEREHYAIYLTKLEDALKAQTPAEPNWVERQKVLTPEQYLAEHAAWQEHKKTVAALEQRAREAQAKVAADHRREQEAYWSSEAKKLLDKIPEWQDPAVADRERADMRRFAIEQCEYTAEELDALYDHRAIVALRKAWQADKRQERRPAVQARLEVIKSASPGPAAATKRQVTQDERLYNRLKKTGKLDDAAGLIANRLLGDL